MSYFLYNNFLYNKLKVSIEIIICHVVWGIKDTRIVDVNFFIELYKMIKRMTNSKE